MVPKSSQNGRGNGRGGEGDGVLRDRAAIVGVGYTEFSKNSGVSTLALALRAIRSACDDAGIAVADLDGVACHRVGDSVQAAVVMQALGMQDPHFFLDQFGGGSASHTIVGQAAMAVACGVADYVVCWRAINARSEFRMGGTGRPPPDVVEFQYQTPYGYATPPQQFAALASAYLYRYGLGREDLAAVAIAQRANAVRNPRAMMRTPLTLEQYIESRWIVEPLCLFDCCLETDAAIAVVVTSAERARDLPQVPVLVSGAVWGGGQTLFSNRHDDITVSAARDASRRLYAQSGVGPADVDVACLYDAFTPLVLLQLEDYGFCGAGEAGAFVRDGATAIGGTLPVNPHGGHLSEGYVHGINHIAEAVQQLRGASGDRQVAGAEVALSTGQPGYVAGSMSALMLRRGD
jgi:acetyl-CoA acetyltransferase